VAPCTLSQETQPVFHSELHVLTSEETPVHEDLCHCYAVHEVHVADDARNNSVYILPMAVPQLVL
jgi:hypothetical protein